MNAITFGNQPHPVQFGKRGDDENKKPGALRKLGVAAALAVPLTLLGATAASAAPGDPPPGNSARFVVGSEGDSFSGQIPEQKGVKNLKESDYTCVVDQIPNLQATTFDCTENTGLTKDMKTGAIGGFMLTVLAALGLRSAGRKIRPGGH